MKTVAISKNYENINIPFGDGTAFTARADVRQENIFKCLEIIKDSNEVAMKLQGMKESKKLEVETAKLMEKLIAQLIGKDKYKELVEAIGGEGAEPYEVNFAMSVLWVELVEFVKERQMRFASSKAAHYMSEYIKANELEAD